MRDEEWLCHKTKVVKGMNKNSVSILLIGDDQQNTDIEEMLLDATLETPFLLHKVGSLEEGLTTLENKSIDAVLLVSALLGNQGNNVMLSRSQAFGVPVVVIGDYSNAGVAANNLREGVQDVLIRQELTPSLLARSLLYAIERQGVLRKLQNESTLDELTGLHNRRGFMSFARHHVMIANRSKWGMILFYADLDNLKWINDSFGHGEGDQAIVTMAAMIKEVFRDSDIVARVGGDEFVALALDADLSFVKNILKRLNEKKKAHSQLYSLSLSVGFAYYDPANPCTIEELMDKADQSMYVNKRAKKVQEERRSPCLVYTPISFPG